MCLLLFLLACQQPFGTSRQDLVGFRILTISATKTRDTIQTSAPTLIDGHLYSDESIRMEWWELEPLESIDAAVEQRVPDQVTPTPHWSSNTPRVGLQVTHPSGETRSGELDINGLPEFPTSLVLTETYLAPPSLSSPSDLEPDQRFQWDTSEGETAWRRLQITGVSTLSRWIGDGRFFELDATTTDWYQGDVGTDDDQVTLQPVDTAWSRWVVIAPSTTGEQPWIVATRVHDDSPAVRVGSLWLSAEAPSTEAYTAIVQRRDEAPFGIHLVPGNSGRPTPCEGRITALLTHECTRASWIGTTLTILPDEITGE